MYDSFKQKYLKYKNKYNNLKKIISLKSMNGGGNLERNVIEELDEKDNILLKKLEEFVKDNCSEEYPLAAGMLHNSGIIHFGLASKSPLGYDVHGEHAVLSQARIFDKNKKNYLSLVAISAKNKLKAPCGICRELIRYHYPELYVIVPHPKTGKLVKIMAKYLLPYPYISTQLPEASKLDDNVEVKYIQKKKKNKRKNN
jgi:cytidine deaminase